MDPVVSVIKSTGHYDGVRKALQLIEEQIEHDIKDKKKILVKPNFVSTSDNWQPLMWMQLRPC